jgi:hypothetical protein
MKTKSLKWGLAVLFTASGNNPDFKRCPEEQ